MQRIERIDPQHASGRSAELLAAVSAAGFDAGEIVELVGHAALNVLTNSFNHVAGTEIDFPLVQAAAA